MTNNRINRYKIELWNIMSPLDNEFLLKILNEQMQYLEKKGVIENSKIMVSIDNLSNNSVNVETNQVKDLSN